jgi:uncharacterized protein (DUF1499 family)
MLRITVLALAGIVLLIVVVLVGLSLMSRRVPEHGLVEGRLRDCPDSPNCVSSEHPDSSAYVPPLETSDPERDFERARRAVSAIGGTVRNKTDSYLWATFQTPVFRFIDDLELRLATEEGKIHLRSASRVGGSDLGKNRERVERLRARYAQLQSDP